MHRLKRRQFVRVHRLLYFIGGDALFDELLVIDLVLLLLLLDRVAEGLANFVGDIMISQHGLRRVQQVSLPVGNASRHR